MQEWGEEHAPPEEGNAVSASGHEIQDQPSRPMCFSKAHRVLRYVTGRPDDLTHLSIISLLPEGTAELPPIETWSPLSPSPGGRPDQEDWGDAPQGATLAPAVEGVSAETSNSPNPAV